MEEEANTPLSQLPAIFKFLTDFRGRLEALASGDSIEFRPLIQSFFLEEMPTDWATPLLNWCTETEDGRDALVQSPFVVNTFISNLRRHHYIKGDQERQILKTVFKRELLIADFALQKLVSRESLPKEYQMNCSLKLKNLTRAKIASENKKCLETYLKQKQSQNVR